MLTIQEADGALTPGEALRELLHDATEFMSIACTALSGGC